VRVSGMRMVWNTHWTRAMENMLDWPHLPFIHANTIGRGMKARAAASRMDVEWEDRPWGAHTFIRIDGQVEPGTLDFRWPNAMNLHIPIPGKRMLMMVSCVPIDAGRTSMLLAMARDFFTSRLFDGLFHRTNLKIATEDKAVVESSFPVEVPPAGDERSVRTDGPTLTFRKRYYQELRGSSAAEGSAALPAGPRRLALAAG
jgi:phenylpropionate dioxygenase-like ring-hydroxylating dioxygenase large terminal subunit